MTGDETRGEAEVCGRLLSDGSTCAQPAGHGIAGPHYNQETLDAYGPEKVAANNARVARLTDAEGAGAVADLQRLLHMHYCGTSLDLPKPDHPDNPATKCWAVARILAARDRARDAEVRRVVEQICANLRGFDGEEGHPGEFISVNEAQRIALDALAEIEEGS